MMKTVPVPCVLALAFFLLSSGLQAAPLDLSQIPCEFPWEHFTTESNTTGILFEDRSSKGQPFFLDITLVPAGPFTLEMTFAMRTLLEQDRSSSIGVQIWEGLERFGKDKSKPGHFLVLFTSEGNLEVQRWNGSYYSTIQRKTRFALRPGRTQTLKVDASRAGSIRVYVNNKIQMTVRPNRRMKIDKETPIRLCAFPGTWLELTELKIFHTSP